MNKQGKEDMKVLRQMNDILNNSGVQDKRRTKTVTFANPEPRVQERPPEPRVQETLPKSRTARPYNPVSHIQKKAQRTNNLGPTTRSKYVMALKEITRRTRSTRNQHMIELAQVILDDNPNPVEFNIEFVNEVFDEETGELLKYRKLIAHPKYHGYGRIPLQMNLEG